MVVVVVVLLPTLLYQYVQDMAELAAAEMLPQVLGTLEMQILVVVVQAEIIMAELLAPEALVLLLFAGKH